MSWRQPLPREPVYHVYNVDGQEVRTNLDPYDLARMTERKRQGFLRKLLRHTPGTSSTEGQQIKECAG